MRNEMFITFVLYEQPGGRTRRAMFFRRCVSGPRRAFARRSVPDQNGSLRMDRDANHYRPGDGEPVGRPLARSSRGDASRFVQSPFSCSRHFVMLPLRPYFSMNLRTLSRPLRRNLVHWTRNTSSLPAMSPKTR